MADNPKPFFERLVEQHQFVMRPNKIKKTAKHPDLVSLFRGKGEDNVNLYVVYGWVSFDKSIGANILKCTMSRVDDQNTAQKLFKTGEPEQPAQTPEGFKFEGDDLAI